MFVKFLMGYEQIAEAYIGEKVKVQCLALEETRVAFDPPHHSQLWHRDPGGERIIKVFVYLTDVDEYSGALRFRNKTFLGKAGTIIIADTTNEHCGGYCTKNKRLMLTGCFLPKTTTWKKMLVTIL